MKVHQEPNETIGLGSNNAPLKVYIANRPPLEEFSQLSGLKTLVAGEINLIAQLTGNHWRKIFNCYAKLAFQLNSDNYTRWQDLRDHILLQTNSKQQLLFSPPNLLDSEAIHIICGRTYFASLNFDFDVEWLDPHFAINVENNLIVSPYFDYRQLSNQKIVSLVDLIHKLDSTKIHKLF